MTQPDDATIDYRQRNSVHEAETIPPSASAAEVVSILDAYMAELQAGSAPDRDALLAAHPELAAQLEACLAGIEFVHRAAGPAAEEPAVLGEFRIVREIVRGGMGVVYEAEQTSLRRRVALKVLRFGVVADEEAMKRFRREAETVARLHHTNIVPIFAVGCERGVHYYAMQLIAGRSLADVLDESQRSGAPLKADDVARWGLQAAEALAHAHHRGVIHRDIKPSNLLVDVEGAVWLTDFGLAKRADEATLTLSGTLMGTPRYMSPEQAETLQRSIDHRTDIYSLGASLYELATGRPVFDSATPHGVVMQILTEEPARPRQVRPELPRDLETIILTCLAKDPAQRYQTAQALADDLRAVLAGMPIQARRVPLVERLARSVRKWRKTIAITAIAAAATVLLIIGGVVGWRYYREWRMGQVVVTTDGPPLRAEVLPESGDEPIGEPFDVVTRAALSLPAGDYRLRVQGNGLLGQNYRLGVNRGETRTYRISLDEDRLLGTESIPYAFATEAMVLSPGKADLVEWTGETLIRRDGATGKPIWDASRPAKPWDEKRDPVAWIRRLCYLGDQRRPGVLVRPAPDLDGDGTGDIVWAFRGTPSLLALSGRDGSMLWTYTAEPDGPGGPDPRGPLWPRTVNQTPRAGLTLATPSVHDVDGDGVPDLIAVFDIALGSSLRTQAAGNHLPYEVWRPGHRMAIAAVSGRSGRALWRHLIDWDVNNSETDRLHFGLIGPTLVHDRRGSIVGFHDDRYWIGLDPATGQPRGKRIDLMSGDRNIGFATSVVRPVQYADLDGDGSLEMLVLKGPRVPLTLAAFSLADGQVLWVESVWSQLPSRNDYRGAEWPLVVEPEWPLVADLDGDGRPEVAIPDVGKLPSGEGAAPISRPPWKRDSPNPMPPLGKDYGGVRLLDGATGRPRWIRPLQPLSSVEWHLNTGLLYVVEGPDLDGDGTNEIVVVSRLEGWDYGPLCPGMPPEPDRVHVDALSGKDGSPLWSWRHVIPSGPHILQLRFPIWPPRWWGRGPDGWPMLLLPTGGNLPTPDAQDNPEWYPEPASIHLLAASTGRECHVLPGLSWPKPADLDGDGLRDLWGSAEGKLRAIRGETPEAWRVLGPFDPAGDLDGDGVPDVLSRGRSDEKDAKEQAAVGPTAVARSGSDGRVLWRRPLDPSSFHQFTTFPLLGGDLDGDGAPEVVVKSGPRSPGWNDGPPSFTGPLEVLSGRSGRRLWSAETLLMDPGSARDKGRFQRVAGLDLRVCETRGQPDMLVFHTLSWKSDKPPEVTEFEGRKYIKVGSELEDTSIPHWQARLARLSGRDGSVKWDVPLLERASPRLSMFNAVLPDVPLREYGDLDGDGRLDAVLDVILETTRHQSTATSPRHEAVASALKAISLADGKAGWLHRIRSQNPDASTFRLGDLDGDGRAEVVVLDEPARKDEAAFELAVLDGRDGSTRWTWRVEDVDRKNPRLPALRLVDFEGKGHRDVCLNVGLADGGRRLAILDAQGRQRTRRELGPDASNALESADLHGDGREELLLQYDGKLRACRGDLAEDWSRPTRGPIREILPARGGQPAAVVINPMLALDGATGHPRWAGRSSLAVLQASVAPSLPRLFSVTSDATICREAVPTTPEGSFAQPRGTLAKPRRNRDDPRWSRPLPWMIGEFRVLPRLFLFIGGLAFVCLILPLAILRLAWRRRLRVVWLLVVLPILIAIPPAAYRWWPGLETRPPYGMAHVSRPWDVKDTSRVGSDLGGVFAYDLQGRHAIAAFIVTTLAGIPFAVYAVVVGRSAIRRRWRLLLLLAGLTAVASIGVGAWWLRSDGLVMAEIEHYDWSGWPAVAVPGAYLVGTLVLVLWTAWSLWVVVRGAIRSLYFIVTWLGHPMVPRRPRLEKADEPSRK
jgi:hypothetical protein